MQDWRIILQQVSGYKNIVYNFSVQKIKVIIQWNPNRDRIGPAIIYNVYDNKALSHQK